MEETDLLRARIHTQKDDIPFSLPPSLSLVLHFFFFFFVEVQLFFVLRIEVVACREKKENASLTQGEAIHRPALY